MNNTKIHNAVPLHFSFALADSFDNTLDAGAVSGAACKHFVEDAYTIGKQAKHNDFFNDNQKIYTLTKIANPTNATTSCTLLASHIRYTSQGWRGFFLNVGHGMVAILDGSTHQLKSIIPAKIFKYPAQKQHYPESIQDISKYSRTPPIVEFDLHEGDILIAMTDGAYSHFELEKNQSDYFVFPSYQEIKIKASSLEDALVLIPPENYHSAYDIAQTLLQNGMHHHLTQDTIHSTTFTLYTNLLDFLKNKKEDEIKKILLSKFLPALNKVDGKLHDAIQQYITDAALDIFKLTVNDLLHSLFNTTGDSATFLVMRVPYYDDELVKTWITHPQYMNTCSHKQLTHIQNNIDIISKRILKEKILSSDVEHPGYKIGEEEFTFRYHIDQINKINENIKQILTQNKKIILFSNSFNKDILKAHGDKVAPYEERNQQEFNKYSPRDTIQSNTPRNRTYTYPSSIFSEMDNMADWRPPLHTPRSFSQEAPFFKIQPSFIHIDSMLSVKTLDDFIPERFSGWAPHHHASAISGCSFLSIIPKEYKNNLNYTAAFTMLDGNQVLENHLHLTLALEAHVHGSLAASTGTACDSIVARISNSSAPPSTTTLNALFQKLNKNISVSQYGLLTTHLALDHNQRWEGYFSNVGNSMIVILCGKTYHIKQVIPAKMVHQFEEHYVAQTVQDILSQDDTYLGFEKLSIDEGDVLISMTEGAYKAFALDITLESDNTKQIRIQADAFYSVLQSLSPQDYDSAYTIAHTLLQYSLQHGFSQYTETVKLATQFAAFIKNKERPILNQFTLKDLSEENPNLYKMIQKYLNYTLPTEVVYETTLQDFSMQLASQEYGSNLLFTVMRVPFYYDEVVKVLIATPDAIDSFATNTLQIIKDNFTTIAKRILMEAKPEGNSGQPGFAIGIIQFSARYTIAQLEKVQTAILSYLQENTLSSTLNDLSIGEDTYTPYKNYRDEQEEKSDEEEFYYFTKKIIKT